MAILYGGGEQGADLRSILSAGDYLNHAILSYDELNSALGWLQAAGCVEERAGRYFPTPVTLTAYQSFKAAHRSALKRWHKLEQFLQTLPVSESPTPGISISPKRYHQALKTYLTSF